MTISTNPRAVPVGGRATSRRRARPLLRLLVCGNADRGDDGAGLLAIARCLPTMPANVLDRIEVRRRDGLQVEDLVDVPPGMCCLIIDAVVGVEPGTIVRVPLSELSHAGAPAPRSSHQLPISQVIALTEALRGRVPDGCLVGVGGQRFGYGSRLSAAVRGSLPAFGEAIVAEAANLIGADRCA